MAGGDLNGAGTSGGDLDGANGEAIEEQRLKAEQVCTICHTLLLIT